MANPFDTQPVNVLQALMAGEEGYKFGRGIRSDREVGAARQQAGEILRTGGDAKSALAALLGAGDIQGANVLTHHNAAGGGYGTPIYGTDAQGNTVLGALDKMGGFKRVDTGGVTPTPGVKMLDTGTGFVPVQSRTGQPVAGGSYQPGAAPQGAPGTPQALVGFIPKDVAGEARQKTEGTKSGEAAFALPAVLSKADQSIAVIDKLINHPGRATATGVSGMIDPRNYIPATDATNFRIALKQLEGQAFLQAFESLKGGGAITEVEGQKATQAIARLDRAQSDEEFGSALNDLKSVLVLGKQRAVQMARSGQGQQRPAPAPQSGGQMTREQYDALPSGSPYTAPDGSQRIKR